MEVTIGEIIKNIRLENINVEAHICYGSNEVSHIVFRGTGYISDYQNTAKELGFDVYKKVDISNMDYYVESIIDTLRNDIMDYQSKNREDILKRKIKEVEMNTYGWE